MRKLIILEHEPLSRRLYDMWCIDKLSKYLELEYWDISQVLYPGIIIPSIIESEYVKKYVERDKLVSAIKNTDSDGVIIALEVMFLYKNRFVFELLKKLNFLCIRIDFYANTAIQVKRRRSLLSYFSIKKVFTYIENFLMSKRYKALYKYSFSSSVAANPDFYINHPDYERFMNEDKISLVSNEYILFIDTYYPYHPDIKYYNNSSIHYVADAYYKSMNKLFKFLEEKYNMPVVIAAHPKAIYEQNPFHGRSIFYNSTSNLVKYAQYIITHESNSLSYIALADVPFMIVYPDSYRLVDGLKDYILKLGELLNHEVFNIDEDYSDLVFTRLDEIIRHDYIENYISHSSIMGTNNYQIILEALKKIEKTVSK